MSRYRAYKPFIAANPMLPLFIAILALMVANLTSATTRLMFASCGDLTITVAQDGTQTYKNEHPHSWCRDKVVTP